MASDLVVSGIAAMLAMFQRCIGSHNLNMVCCCQSVGVRLELFLVLRRPRPNLWKGLVGVMALCVLGRWRKWWCGGGGGCFGGFGGGGVVALLLLLLLLLEAAVAVAAVVVA